MFVSWTVSLPWVLKPLGTARTVSTPAQYS